MMNTAGQASSATLFNRACVSPFPVSRFSVMPRAVGFRRYPISTFVHSVTLCLRRNPAFS